MVNRKSHWKWGYGCLFSLWLLLGVVCSAKAANYDVNAFVTKWKPTGSQIVVPFESRSAQVRYYEENAVAPAFSAAKQYSNDPKSNDCLKVTTVPNKTYILEIKGEIDKFSMSLPNGGAAQGTVNALLSIEQWGNGKWRNLNGAFANCVNLEIANSVKGEPDLTLCEDLSFMFRGCTRLRIVDPQGKWKLQNIKNVQAMFEDSPQFNDQKIANWDVKNVENFNRMFYRATSFNVKIDNWEVSKATTMSQMFFNCFNFKGEGLDKWATKVNRVTNFYMMFYGCKTLNFDPTDWNIESVTIITYMFYDCSLLGASMDLDFTKWAGKLKRVTSLTNLFAGCQNITGKGVEQWLLDKNHKITNLESLFSGCTRFNADLTAWHVDNVENFYGLFNNCESYEGKGIAKWKVGNATGMGSMFRNCKKMKENLKDWDVSKVKNMATMFAFCPDLKTDFSKWDVGACTSFRGMFYNCGNFNGDLQNWDVSQGVDFYAMFYACSKFNVDLSRWRMRSAINTSSMFSGCTEFNADISAWNVENVTDANSMFMGCEKFNANLSRWRFKNLQRMDNMFNKCKVFNADLRRWDVSHVKRMDGLFRDAEMFQGEHIGIWNVGEVENFAYTFAGASAFIGDLSKWDLHSATNLTYMFWNSNCANTDFSDWNIENVTTLQGTFYGAQGNIYGVTQWNTKNVSNFSGIFTNAKGMQHPIGDWDYSSLPEGGQIGLDGSGLSVDAYNRTLEGWEKNTTLRKPIIQAKELYYSNKYLHDTQLKANKSFQFINDKYVDKNLSLTVYKMRLKVGQKKELKVQEQKGATSILFVTEPIVPKRIAYDDNTSMVEGKIPGKAVVRVTSNSMVNPPLHNLCDIEVYLPILDLKWEKSEYDLAIGDVLDLRRRMKISPYNASWPRRISFKVSDADKEFVEIKDETSGRIKGLKEGTVTVTVETFDVEDENERVTKTLTVNVKRLDAEKIQIHPNEIILGVGTKVFAKVFFTPKNTTDKALTFEIEGDNTVATVDATVEPTVTGAKVGTCKLVAKSANGKEAKVNVRVIENFVPVEDVRYISGHSFPLLLGSSRNLSVSVTPTNASNKKLYWESTNEEIATVDQEGRVYGLKEGKVPIRVYSVENKLVYDVCEVDVYNNPVQGIELVGESLVKIGLGEKYKLRYRLLPEGVSNKEVACLSADPSTVSVDAETAEVVGEKIGGPVEITIKAVGADANDNVELKVYVQCVSKVAAEKLILDPVNLGLFPGDDYHLNLKFQPEDATDRDVLWTTTSEDIVEVDENGYLKAKEAGTATIKVTLKSDPAISATCNVSVHAHVQPKSLELRPQTITIGEGDEYKLAVFVQPINSTKYTLEWNIDDPDNVLSLNEEEQIVKGVKVGTGKVLVSLKGNSDVKSECIVTVVPKVATTSFDFEPKEFEIEFNTELNLNEKLVFAPENATDRWMDWTSENPDVVQVREGYVRGLVANSEGIVITAQLHSDPSKKATCRIKVKEPSSPLSIIMSSQLLRIKVGDERNITVIYNPTDVTDRKLEWRSSNSDILSVNENGKIVGIAKGTVAVIATLQSDPKIMAVCTVEVLDANTTELVTAIGVEDVTLTAGTRAKLKVTYMPADAIGQQLLFEGYDPAKFVIANGEIIALSSTGDEPVEVTAMLATDPAVKTTFKVTVRPIVPAGSFRLNLDKLLIYELNNAYLRVITEPEDADKTGVIWSSDNESVCTVSQGVVYGVSEGVAHVTATLNGKTATCEVTVRKQNSTLSVDDDHFVSLSVFPNPFNEKLRIVYSGEISNVRYELVNTMGFVVRSGRIEQEDSVIETTSLTAGLYILRITTETGRTKSIRVVK